MTDEPRLTEIARWEYRPGDRLIAYTDMDIVSREHALAMAAIRRRLQLPGDSPVIIAGPGWRFEVLSGVD